MTDDLEQLFSDAMAWGMVYGEILCASKCWHEERDKRAKEYAEKALPIILKLAVPTGKPIIITQNPDGTTTVIEIVKIDEMRAVESDYKRCKRELEEDENYNQAFNSGGRDYD